MKVADHLLANSLVHQPFEYLGEVPCEMSVEKCVILDVSHIIFGDKGYIFTLKSWKDSLNECLVS